MSSSSTGDKVLPGSGSRQGMSPFNPNARPFINFLLPANPFRDQMPTKLMQRGEVGFGKAGKTAKVNINSHEVLQWPNRDVYLYDVSRLLFYL